MIIPAYMNTMEPLLSRHIGTTKNTLVEGGSALGCYKDTPVVRRQNLWLL